MLQPFFRPPWRLILYQIHLERLFREREGRGTTASNFFITRARLGALYALWLWLGLNSAWEWVVCIALRGAQTDRAALTDGLAQ